jgi:hypothetical protein
MDETVVCDTDDGAKLDSNKTGNYMYVIVWTRIFMHFSGRNLRVSLESPFQALLSVMNMYEQSSEGCKE